MRNGGEAPRGQKEWRGSPRGQKEWQGSPRGQKEWQEKSEALLIYLSVGALGTSLLTPWFSALTSVLGDDAPPLAP